VRGSEAPRRSTRGDQAAVCVHIDTQSSGFGSDEARFALNKSSIQPVLHHMDEIVREMDETTNTIYDTFFNDVRGELVAIGHAQGEMLQVLQDEHMQDEMRISSTVCAFRVCDLCV
jgi:hypothetical protein